MPMRSVIFGVVLPSAAALLWTSNAQFTASTTLANSTSVPSPISLTTRPLCWATAGSNSVRRCCFNAASVPASSPPIIRE
jgi:hypothetical protein